MALEHRSNPRPIRIIPSSRRTDYEPWLREMSIRFPGAEAEIRAALDQYVDEWLVEHRDQPNAAFCSSWIPGSDWSDQGTYQPMYLTMLGIYRDHSLAHPRAGWFFGLILMDVMIHRPENWECWHEEKAEPEDNPDGNYYRLISGTPRSAT
jgi:hypothetical protein